MTVRPLLGLWICCLGLVGSPAPAQQMAAQYGAPVSLNQAREIVTRARQAAAERRFSMAFAIVEPGGQLVLFEKMDGTQYGSELVAQEKAKSAARFKRPTKAFSDAVAGGRTAVLSLPGAIAIEGGVPIVIQGRIVGALGVSGGTSEQDGKIAAAALRAPGK
ncbi:heme-binding protein [Sphingomonas sp. LY54]|uniref:GlcG/HbpS family heme-binding protein n=1 Tax=Sphingomonas sp. LY54 TaxID=3095343 RepID=UPI002D7712FF|nr:heme-binding protein [Sphingomonas sp. LY54]WRP29960.1 heme-binding protein [Sphingomonas sp. LY54]